MKRKYSSILIIILIVLFIIIALLLMNKNKEKIEKDTKDNYYLSAEVLKKSSIYNNIDINKKVINTVEEGKSIKVKKEEFEDNLGEKYYETLYDGSNSGYIKASNIMVDDININKEKQIIKGESLIENNIRNITGR